MLIGYARVSTRDQETHLQLDALNRAGADRIFQDKSSGVGARPQLHQALASIKAGDHFIVWKLDRIARSLFDLLAIIDRINTAGGSIRSLTEPIDTASPYGRFTLQVLGSVAELERSIIKERIMAGQAAARERGVPMGRPRLLDEEGEALAVDMYTAGAGTTRDIGSVLGVSQSAIRGCLWRAGLIPGPLAR